MYDPREVTLALRVIDEFGPDVALARPPEIRWQAGEPVAKVGDCECSIGQDDRLWLRYVHAGVAHIGVRENGRTQWLAAGPLAPAGLN